MLALALLPAPGHNRLGGMRMNPCHPRQAVHPRQLPQGEMSRRTLPWRLRRGRGELQPAIVATRSRLSGWLVWDGCASCVLAHPARGLCLQSRVPLRPRLPARGCRAPRPRGQCARSVEVRHSRAAPPRREDSSRRPAAPRGAAPSGRPQRPPCRSRLGGAAFPARFPTREIARSVGRWRWCGRSRPLMNDLGYQEVKHR
jgi:hypothetical protein